MISKHGFMAVGIESFFIFEQPAMNCMQLLTLNVYRYVRNV